MAEPRESAGEDPGVEALDPEALASVAGGEGSGICPHGGPGHGG
jgi:hypothetical protein